MNKQNINCQLSKFIVTVWVFILDPSKLISEDGSTQLQFYTTPYAVGCLLFLLFPD